MRAVASFIEVRVVYIRAQPRRFQVAQKVNMTSRPLPWLNIYSSRVMAKQTLQLPADTYFRVDLDPLLIEIAQQQYYPIKLSSA